MGLLSLSTNTTFFILPTNHPSGRREQFHFFLVNPLPNRTELSLSFSSYLAQAKGIEPLSADLESAILPLNYTCWLKKNSLVDDILILLLVACFRLGFWPDTLILSGAMSSYMHLDLYRLILSALHIIWRPT